jgi:hypothetical protein
MALTVSRGTDPVRSADVWGQKRVQSFVITPDSAFAAAGETFDPVAQGFPGPVRQVIITPRYVAAAAGANFQYDYANKLILAFCGSTVTGGSVDLSTVLLDVLVIGK